MLPLHLSLSRNWTSWSDDTHLSRTPSLCSNPNGHSLNSSQPCEERHRHSWRAAAWYPLADSSHHNRTKDRCSGCRGDLWDGSAIRLFVGVFGLLRSGVFGKVELGQLTLWKISPDNNYFVTFLKCWVILPAVP